MLREKREMKWWKTNGDGRHAPRSVGTPLHNLYNVRVFTLEKHSLLDHRDTTNATTAKKKSIQDGSRICIRQAWCHLAEQACDVPNL